MTRRILLFLMCIMMQCASSAFGDQVYQFERMWPTLKQPWYFNRPYSAAADAAGNIYVADTANNRIQKFTSNGMLIVTWGLKGTGPGAFDTPSGIAVSGSGHVYVADTLNNRIQKFTMNGDYVVQWGSPGSEAGQFNEPCALAINAAEEVFVADMLNHRIQKFSSIGEPIGSWGEQGTGPGQFDKPRGIALDGNGYVYVAEKGNNRIQKMTDTGIYMSMWGAFGSNDREFNTPMGIAADSSNAVYVVDNLNHRVQKFTDNGTFIRSFGSQGTADDQFNLPCGICVDHDGHVYVADTENYCIKKFSSDGAFVSAWTSAIPEYGRFNNPCGIEVDPAGTVYVIDNSNNRVLTFSDKGILKNAWGSIGSAPGPFFDRPFDAALGADGSVYVTDSLNNRIQKFDASGNFVKTWDGSDATIGSLNQPYGIAAAPDGKLYVADRMNHRIRQFSDNGTSLLDWGGLGTDDEKFVMPTGITVDSAGFVYVTDSGNRRVQKFTSNGTFVLSWGSKGSDSGQFKNPSGIFSTQDGSILVADTGNNRIQVFSSTGAFITSWGTFGTSPGQLNTPDDVAVGPDGRVFVSDTKNHRIQVFKQVNVLENPKAIIVAGGGPGEWNSLWDATQLNANYAYRALTFQGYTKESIFYLSADSDLDLDGNGFFDDVDNDTTRANLEDAITQWAADADSVIIYLVDHGGDGSFRMSENEILTAVQLDGWIDDLQDEMPGRVIVVYDACESGSFIDALQGPNRTIITSTSEGERAKFLNQGSTSFSFFFWTYIFNGMTLEEAFNTAAQNINFAFDSQTSVASGLEPGVAVGNGVNMNFGQAPVIGQVSPPQTLTTETSASIYAWDITCSDNITSVWAVIWRPNFEPGTFDNPALNLPKIPLVYNSAQARYEGVYDNCTDNGTYQVAVYAMDRTGLASLPKQTILAKNYFLKRRVILVGGTETMFMPWSSIEKSLQHAYGAVKAQGYADDSEMMMFAPRSIPGVTATVNLNTLEYLEPAITQWGAGETQDLVLYLVGAGSEGTFRLNDSETLTTATLDGWLDNLQGQMNGKVTVVYDADSSGSFISVLTPPVDRQRIIITSTGAGSAAYFSAEGNLSFSSNFWSQIASGSTVYSSFAYAKKSIEYLSRKRNIAFSCTMNQSPVLDDNGNGIGNEEADGAVARKASIGIGIKFAADPPQIGAAGAQNDAGGIRITASDISTTGTLESVWALVTPLAYCPGSTGTEPAQVVRVEMGDNETAGTYTGVYSGSVQACKIAVYARDTDNQTSAPKETKVYQSQGADMYEIDDTWSQANVIVINQGLLKDDGTKMGLGQPHNFHYAADEDWMMLYALAGQTYTVEADTIGANCRPVIELYGSENHQTPLAVESSIIENAVFLDWQCPQDGVYYVRMVNSAGAETDTEYELAVYIPEQGLPGYIVGTIKNAATSERISGAIIKTYNGGSVIGSTISAVGDYQIDGHPTGTYTLTAQAQGYMARSLSGVQVEAGEIVTKNITLTLVSTTSTTSTTTPISSGSTTTTIGGTQTTTSVPGRLCPAKKALGEDNPNLAYLHSFRDKTLVKSALGRKAIQIYYNNTDNINAALDRSPTLRAFIRKVLEVISPMVGKK